jgi:NAD+ diphosphatase
MPDVQPSEGDTAVHFEDGLVLIKEFRNRFELPKVGDFADGTAFTYLFSLDDERFFITVDDDTAVPEGFKLDDPRSLRLKYGGPKHRAFAVITALHLWHWYRDSRFCGRCGCRTVNSDVERARVCPNCGNIIYPRIVPAVIVAVRDGDRLLLTRYAHRRFKRYALIAGFTEIGETLEQTVEREVMEETGLHVKNITYYGSQPWGVVDDILAGFVCDVDGSTDISLDRNELQEGTWMERSEIPVEPDDNSLTNEMITRFKEGLL